MGNGSNRRAQLTQILAIASENKLLHLKLDIEQLLGLNTEAAFTSISLFCDRGFGQQNFVYLDTAQAVLMREPSVNQDNDTKDLI